MSSTLLVLPQIEVLQYFDSVTAKVFSLINLLVTGPNTGFEFGHECIKLLKHHKCQKILQTGRSFVFCFMFRQICFALKDELFFLDSTLFLYGL